MRPPAVILAGGKSSRMGRGDKCLLPLGEQEALEVALNRFWPAFRHGIWIAILDRLGLEPRGDEENAELVSAIFTFLYETQMPYEQFFFDWRGGWLSNDRAAKSPSAEHYQHPSFVPIREAFEFYEAPAANLGHPYFARSTPRTMLIDEMEALWAPIAERDDWSALYAALDEIDEMRTAYSQQTSS